MALHLTGVLLLNLGTPDGCDVASVRRYLKEFLDDPRVVDLPWWLRKPLLYGAILPFRPKQSAKAYSCIWDPQKGSPLFYHMQALTEKVQAALGENYLVAMGMRYGKPSIKEALRILLQAKCERIVVLPLFPQYSNAASGSAIQNFFEALKDYLHLPSINVLNAFYHEQSYVQAQSAVIQSALMQAQPDHILFSYHSLPVRQILKNADCASFCQLDKACHTIDKQNMNCYRAQCFETSRLLGDQLNITKEKYSTAFQSRLGRTIWIGPDIESTFTKLVSQGVRNLLVACPSFVVDCLETLEEIGIRAKETWCNMGGKQLTLAPCLNTDPQWVKTLVDFVQK